MKIVALVLLILDVSAVTAQRNSNSYSPGFEKIYESRYVQQPPVHDWGPDSCNRYYFDHFGDISSIVSAAVMQGDTAKYLRVYFSFVINRFGFISEPRFIKLASTRYAQSVSARTLTYLNNDAWYEKQVKQMLRNMPPWRPALQNGVPVNCRVETWFQFLVTEMNQFHQR